MPRITWHPFLFLGAGDFINFAILIPNQCKQPKEVQDTTPQNM
jgi:hypothetical protein